MWNSACRWAKPRLALLAGDELAGDDRRRAERHLIVCGECRSRLGSLRSALGALGMLSAEAVPSQSPSLWPALARQIRESRHPEPATFAIRPIWMGLGIAASALMAAGLTTWGVGRVRPGGESVASKPLSAKAPVPSPAFIETNPSATVAEVTPSHRPDGEAIPSAPATSARKENGSSSGRIGVEQPTQ